MILYVSQANATWAYWNDYRVEIASAPATQIDLVGGDLIYFSFVGNPSWAGGIYLYTQHHGPSWEWDHISDDPAILMTVDPTSPLVIVTEWGTFEQMGGYGQWKWLSLSDPHMLG